MTGLTVLILIHKCCQLGEELACLKSSIVVYTIKKIVLIKLNNSLFALPVGD